MCLNDYRLGTLIRSVIRSDTLTVGVTLRAPPNKQRCGITLMSQAVVASASPLVTVDGLGVGIIGGVGFQVMHWTFATHGDLPTKEIVLTGQGVGAVCSIIEYILPQSFTTAMIEEFMREYPNMRQVFGY